jgi:ribonuclease P protein component
LPGFPKEERLLSRSEFLRLSAQGHTLHAPHFIIVYRSTTVPVTRIGITVSRKVGNAVVRNRLKRLIREFYRQNKGLFPVADCNVIARQGAGGLDSHQVGQELVRALRRQHSV